MKLKEGDTFYTHEGVFVIKNGIPVKEPKIQGTFGGELIRAQTIKESVGKEFLLLGIIDPKQPRNNTVRVKLIKDRRGTAGQDFQVISLDANVVVEVFEKVERQPPPKVGGGVPDKKN